jgi:putative ABC transport system permease protein
VIRHYLKLIWNRRRTNLLITVEIFFSFLVVFAVVAMAAYYLNNYRQPLGFRWDDVWAVSIEAPVRPSPGRDDKAAEEAARETLRQVHLAVQEFPEVVAVAGAFTVPYGNSRWNSAARVDGREYEYSLDGVTDRFAEVMGLRIVDGRWFSKEDDASTSSTVVVNQRLATALFRAERAVGRNMPQERTPGGEPPTEMRIVGVVDEFRQDGELADPENYVFVRHRLDRADTNGQLSDLAIRVRPGTTAAFEEPLVKRMQAVAKDWSFEVRPLADMRAARHRDTLKPLVAEAIIGGFLMLMVALGLTGVLWQTVTQRTREIGLRRAKGATIPNIRAQILGELVVMTTLAVLLGAAIVMQFPLLKVFGFVTGGVYAVSLVISALCIYLLTVACAWYPSRMATTIQPAEALHYE